MIARETVVRIIQSNSKSVSESKKQKAIAGNYQWSKSRQDLCEEIANLSDNDLLDLLAVDGLWTGINAKRNTACAFFLRSNQAGYHDRSTHSLANNQERKGALFADAQ